MRAPAGADSSPELPGKEPTQEQVVWQEMSPMGSMLDQSTPEGLHPVLLGHIGGVLEELQPVESPHRVSLGRMASCGRDLMLKQGKRVTMKEQQMMKR